MILLFLALLLPQQEPGPQYPEDYDELMRQFDEAAKRLERLSPMAFEAVPLEIREELSERGCTILQTPYGEEPHNIASGEFAAPGQTDWAALCSRDGSSEIVILWGGPARCPPLGRKRSDRRSLQTGVLRDDAGKTYVGVICPRSIGSALPVTRNVGEIHKVSPLPERTHESVTDWIADKGGSAHYCHEGRWIQYVVGD